MFNIKYGNIIILFVRWLLRWAERTWTKLYYLCSICIGICESVRLLSKVYEEDPFLRIGCESQGKFWHELWSYSEDATSKISVVSFANLLYFWDYLYYFLKIPYFCRIHSINLAQKFSLSLQILDGFGAFLGSLSAIIYFSRK